MASLPHIPSLPEPDPNANHKVFTLLYNYNTLCFAPAQLFSELSVKLVHQSFNFVVNAGAYTAFDAAGAGARVMMSDLRRSLTLPELGDVVAAGNEGCASFATRAAVFASRA